MFVLGVLLCWPMLRYGFPFLGHVFDGDKFTRALSALILFSLLFVAAIGVGLIVLGIGLVRGSRVAQLLTCLLCGVVALSEMVTLSQTGPAAYGAIGLAHGVMIAVLLISLAAIVLITALPNARAFFAQDKDRPFGVLVASAVAIYFGASIALVGVLFMIGGAVGAKYIWWGIGLTVAGAWLVATTRYLRAGRNSARIGASVAFVIAIVLMFVVNNSGGGQGASLTTLVPLGLGIAALAGLWLPQSSSRHFAEPRELPALTPAAGIGMIVALIALIALAAVGFASGAHSEASTFGSSYDSSSDNGYYNSEPSYPKSADEPTEQTYAVITADDASNYIDSALSELEDDDDPVTDCDGTDVDPSGQITDYQVGDITPQTDGDFDVDATVTFDDGSTQVVTYEVRDNGTGGACIDSDQLADVQQAEPSEPSDVPEVPAADEPVPVDAALPDPPQDDQVVPYTDDSTVPTDQDQLVEWVPDDLDDDQTAAVQDVIAFMTHVNQQDFNSAWNDSTESLSGSSPSSAFRRGYATTHFYQVAFGEPQTLADDLIAIPARFVSRQDPAAQGNAAGVTDCTYWPQYVFVVAESGGQWLDDVAGEYFSRPELAPLKRAEPGGTYLNPLNQRVSC